MDEIDHGQAANRVRASRWWICFEEPDDPMVWPEKLGDGLPRPTIPLRLCRPHQDELGCGWFTIHKAVTS